jgi:hypothetical protein
MISRAVEPDQVSESNAAGMILAHDVVAVGESGRLKLPKGHILEPSDLPALRGYSGEIHLIEMEPDDVHEDEASTRLARAVCGQGVDLRPPVESQTHLRAAHRGVVSVCTRALEAMNSLPDVSVFTVYDGQPVDVGKAVGAAKVTPLAIPGEILRQAEQIARDAHPILEVRPFLGESVGVVVRDRVTGKAQERFEAAIDMKIGWFGSTVAGIRYLPENVEEIATAIRELLASDVSLILAAGVNSTDPLDLTLQALDREGAVTERRGVPAHPGSTCWLAYAGEVPIFGLALCGMFSQTTVLDLLLPRFLSGQKVRAADIAAFGHGGMLGKDMPFRFPEYTRR